MVKSNSFDTSSRTTFPDLDSNYQSIYSVSAGVNSFDSSSFSKGSRGVGTPEISRRGSRRGAGMIKTRSFDMDDSRAVAPGVAVHPTPIRSILQKELDTLSAVTRRLNDSRGDALDGFSSASGGSGFDGGHSGDSSSSRTLSPTSLQSNDGHMDGGLYVRKAASRRGSADLVERSSRTPNKVTGSHLRPEPVESRRVQAPPQEKQHGGFRNIMEAMFPKKKAATKATLDEKSGQESQEIIETSRHVKGKDSPEFDRHHYHRDKEDVRHHNAAGKYSKETHSKLMPSKGEFGSLSAPDFPSQRPRYCLNDFDIREQIGKGAFARVHLVKFKSGRGGHHGGGESPAPFQKSASKIYAMKSLRKPDIVATKQVKHVMNEKTLLQSIRHPFIVELVATFQDSRHLYLVLEYISGGDLFTHLRRNRRFSESVARFYTVELVLAMEHIHSKGIIYRDLKPENILLDKDGHIKIADFGFARIIHSRESALTFCGTPAYMAPEIILKVGYTKAVDWWSLGIVSYELQAGYSPFQAETPIQIYEKIVDGKMRWSSQIGAVSKDILKRLLEMDPHIRMGAEGAKEVKAHSWFRDVDWKAHEGRMFPVPYKPAVLNEEDISNFDVYTEPSSVTQMQKGTLELGADDLAYDEYFKDF
ncbi:hypothetical protein HDU67_009046 [Dinochytrium kinnereticum]|nr:hypothetical protein HDU67_009046 [Dinochytrium kinnereticum]